MLIALVALLYATWSSIFPIGKWTLQFCPPIFLTSVRMLLAGSLILGYLALRRRELLKISRRQFFAFLLFGVIGIYLNNICEFWGLQRLSAAKTCFIYSLSPFCTALFSFLHFKEKMNPKKWLGMGIGLLGMIPVLSLQSFEESSAGGMGLISWPALAVILAAITGVYGWIILRLTVKDQESSPLTANGFGMFIGGGIAFIHSYFTENWHPTPVTDVSSFWQGTLAMTVISNILCFNLYGFMLKRMTATFLSFMGLLSPIFASLSSWALLGEPLKLEIFLSTGILCIGLWMVYQAELKQGYIKKEDSSAPEAA